MNSSTEALDRKVYYRMKERRISTLDLHHVLKSIGIEIPQRTLQYHLDSNFKTTIDDRLKFVADEMIKNYDELITNLSKKIEI
jgi:hypothetical protein